MLLLFFALWVLAVVLTLGSLLRNRASLFDDDFTPDDAVIASRTGFLVLAPCGVILQEALQMLAAAAFSLPYRTLWISPGRVLGNPLVHPEERFAVAAAGAMFMGCAAIALLWGGQQLRNPMRTLVCTAGASVAVLGLVAEPLLNLLRVGGDFSDIYSARTPVASAIAVVAHALLLATCLALAKQWQRMETLAQLQRLVRLQAQAEGHEPDPQPDEGDPARPVR